MFMIIKIFLDFIFFKDKIKKNFILELILEKLYSVKITIVK